MTEILAPVTELAADACWDLLRSNQFGRLAVTVADEPDIFPINYAVQDETLVFRTAQGTKLAALTVNDIVALEIDGYDQRSGWSVVVKGRAHPAHWGTDFDDAAESGVRPWVAATTRKRVFVRIVPAQVSGRSFVLGPEPDDS
jgi:nitroimidazol reductase NimA-like FMN-containing flavoprotein (pyridoxamine 5'-phosphate oxidase superfamily)